MESHYEWLKERQKGIGGSDVGAILGVNPYKTAYDVWMEKISPEPIEIEDNQSMKAGRMLEKAVADWFAEETGMSVSESETIHHPEKPYLIANIDRLLTNENGEKGILECKTASGYAADTWDTEIPLIYYLQLQHYMYVLNVKWGYVAILVDGRDFKYYRYERDDELLNQIIPKLEAFWSHVQDGTPPPAQNADDIIKQYPQDSGKTVTAVSHIEQAIEELKSLKAQIKELENQKNKVEFIIKEYMGDAAVLVNEDGVPLATWKASKPTKRFDSKRFKAENPDIFEKYQVEIAGSRRFLLKGEK